MAQKVVFISYSWDNEAHRQWVLTLADNLVKNGIDVILDQYDLSAGKEMTHFMERAMLADKVLVILTENYNVKAEKREGGVGYEYSLITKELYDNAPDQTRILPVLRIGDGKSSAPSYMATRIYHDMRSDATYDSQLFNLIKLILDQPLVKKPTLGTVPSFDDVVSPDIDKTISDFKKKEDFVKRKKALMESSEGVRIFLESSKQVVKQIRESLIKIKENYNLHTYIKESDQPPSITFTTVYFTGHFGSEIRFSNSTEGAHFKMNLFKGPVGFTDYAFDYWEQTQVLYGEKYSFDLDENLQPIFVKDGAESIKLKATDIASALVRDLFTREIKRRDDEL